LMTKVILAWTDERGGCRNAQPQFAEGLAEETMHRGQERD